MDAGGRIAVGVLFVLAGAGAWWVMSGVDVGPDVAHVAPPRAAQAGSDAPADPPPAARPPAEPRAILPQRADPPPLTLQPPVTDDAQAPDLTDQEHFLSVARDSMDAKLASIRDAFAAAARVVRGAEREDVKRVLHDAYGEMRDVNEQLVHGELDPGAAFGEIERIRDRAGREIDATLPPDRAIEVKAAAGVRSPDEAASAVDWGVPLDDATSDVIFR